MKLFTLLLATTITAVSAFPDTLWCNGGSSGNGLCEGFGWNTYCVSRTARSLMTHTETNGIQSVGTVARALLSLRNAPWNTLAQTATAG